jgi:cell division protein FtsW (lipid II flippase)
MKDKFYRFYWIEHPLMMFVSIVLITIARGKLKKNNYSAAAWMLLVALLLILAAIPWPFREVVGEGRKWLPGM